jgi:uncharacterized membrane protein YjjP (DUF1212 family)
MQVPRLTTCIGFDARASAAPGVTLIQINRADSPHAPVQFLKAFGVLAPEFCKVCSGGASNMSLMFIGAIVALIVVVMALGGSQTARKWAIGMYSLVAVLLLAISYF